MWVHRRADLTRITYYLMFSLLYHGNMALFLVVTLLFGIPVIVFGEGDRLVITSSLEEMVVGEPQKIIVQIQDVENNPLPAQQTTIVHLFTTSLTGSFLSASLSGNCGQPLPLTYTDKVHARIVIASGTSQKAFCFQDQVPGQHYLFFTREDGIEYPPGEIETYLSVIQGPNNLSDDDIPEPVASSSSSTVPVVAGTSTASTTVSSIQERVIHRTTKIIREFAQRPSSYVPGYIKDIINLLESIIRYTNEDVRKQLQTSQ